jgi:hypothetical protein
MALGSSSYGAVRKDLIWDHAVEVEGISPQKSEAALKFLPTIKMSVMSIMKGERSKRKKCGWCDVGYL